MGWGDPALRELVPGSGGGRRARVKAVCRGQRGGGLGWRNIIGSEITCHYWVAWKEVARGQTGARKSQLGSWRPKEPPMSGPVGGTTSDPGLKKWLLVLVPQSVEEM